MDEAFRKIERVRRKAHCPWRGELFHAGREIRGVPDGRILHVQVVSDCPDDDFAGIQADAQFDFYAVGTAHLTAVGANRGLHRQCGITRAHGMVLVRQRRTEYRHDAVAHHMVHRAFIAVHGFHYLVDNRIDDLARLFRVAIAQEFH